MKKLTKVTAAAGLIIALGCSSKPAKVNYSDSTNPRDEVSAISNDMNTALQNQADVLAPKSYTEAQKHLEKAQKLTGKDVDNKKIADEAGYARAYLNQAQEISARSTAAMPEVVKARQEALAAGAHQYQSKELAKADRDLKDITKKFEKENPSVGSKEKIELQAKYMAIELEAIKGTRLGASWKQIDNAERAGAKRLAPKTLDQAKADYKNAEAVISANRHDEARIGAAVATAAASAQKLDAVTQAAKNTKGQTTEDTALNLVNQGQAIQSLDQQVGAVTSQNQAQSAQLDQTRQQLTAAQIAARDKSKQLDSEQKFNAAFEEARQQFKPEEADVYRQGNNLLIRLKGLNFASGRSDLPAQAMPILAKTKDIIKEMNAEKVVIEGHTDAVGAKATNEKLSQSRADAVAKYFVAEDVVPQNEVEAKGYGFEKPISSNKTKAGRAENRRVDVIITPATM